MKAVSNSFAPEKKQSFSQMLTTDSMKKMLLGALGSPERAASFTSTLISAQQSSDQMKLCDPKTIISAALRGEGMNLSLALGQYAIVPYGDKATFQLQYKGVAQLAIRSNEYIDFDVYDVREGEYKGRDPRTRQPLIEWIENEDTREETPLAGFYGFYQLKSGFFKSIYWTHEKILRHANRYSKAFDMDKYSKLMAGELDAQEAQKLRGGSPWYDEPLSEAHQKMCKKTVLIQLLNDGKAPLSIEMQRAIAIDAQEEADGAPVIIPDAEGTIPEQPALPPQEMAPADTSASRADNSTSEGEHAQESREKAGKRASVKHTEPEAGSQEAVDNFFGGRD